MVRASYPPTEMRGKGCLCWKIDHTICCLNCIFKGWLFYFSFFLFTMILLHKGGEYHTIVTTKESEAHSCQMTHLEPLCELKALQTSTHYLPQDEYDHLWAIPLPGPDADAHISWEPRRMTLDPDILGLMPGSKPPLQHLVTSFSGQRHFHAFLLVKNIWSESHLLPRAVVSPWHKGKLQKSLSG